MIWNIIYFVGAGWSSLEARRAHNPKVAGSNPAPAIRTAATTWLLLFFILLGKTALH